MNVNIPGPVKALAKSRKFWIGVIGVIAAIVLFAQGTIEAGELSDAIVTLASIVISAIAVEDAAEKLSKRD